MHKLNRTERAVMATLVERTRELLSDTRLTVAEKADRLMGWTHYYRHRAHRLKRAQAVCTSAARAQNLGGVIGIRERAATYLETTARWVRGQAIPVEPPQMEHSS
jgi:hypothetical protein